MLKKNLFFFGGVIVIAIGCLIAVHNISDKTLYESISCEKESELILYKQERYEKKALINAESFCIKAKKLLNKKKHSDKIKELNEKLKGLEELKQASSYENMGKIYYLKEEKENAQKYLRDALDYYEKGLKKLRIRKEPLNIKELKLLLEGLNVK